MAFDLKQESDVKEFVDKFTISIRATDATHGALVLEWGDFRWTAPIVVK